MSETKTISAGRRGFRGVLLGALFGAVVVVGGCVVAAPPVTTTTTERTTTQQSTPSPYAYPSPDTSVTTTRTQQYRP